MPKIQVFAIVCDPVDRFEKFFFMYQFCQDEYPRVEYHPDQGLGCHHSIAAALDHDPQAPQYYPIAGNLRVLQRLFSERLQLFHQESIRTSPQATYDWLASLLG